MRVNRVSGLDFFKLLGAVTMCLAHTGMFLSRGLGVAQPEPHSHLGYDLYILIGFFSVSLPALAGSSLRSFLDKYLVGGKILNYDFADIIKVGLFLMILESIKNVLIHEPLMFFSWDVLHFISLSFVIIVWLLSRWGSRALAVFSIASVLIGATVPPWLSSDSGGAVLQLILLVSKILLWSLVLLSPAAVFLFWSYKFQKNRPYFSSTRKLLLTGASFATGLLLGGGLWFFLKDQVFFKQISEVAFLAMLFRVPQTFGHLWPLFPWFTLVGGGFILQDFFSNAKNRTRNLWLGLFLSLAIFIGFFFFLFQDYRVMMVKDHYFSSTFFRAPATVILGILSFYSAVYIASTLFFRRFEFHSKVIYNFSRGLLFFYFVHFIVAHVFYKPFAEVFGLQWAMILLPWFVLIVSYFILVFILRFLDRPLLVNLRRRL